MNKQLLIIMISMSSGACAASASNDDTVSFKKRPRTELSTHSPSFTQTDLAALARVAAVADTSDPDQPVAVSVRSVVEQSFPLIIPGPTDQRPAGHDLPEWKGRVVHGKQSCLPGVIATAGSGPGLPLNSSDSSTSPIVLPGAVCFVQKNDP